MFSGAVSVDYDPDDHSLFSQKKLKTLRKGAVFGVSQDSCVLNSDGRLLAIPYKRYDAVVKRQNKACSDLFFFQN